MPFGGSRNLTGPMLALHLYKKQKMSYLKEQKKSSLKALSDSKRPKEFN